MAIRFLDLAELENVREVINRDDEFRVAAKFFSNDVLFAFGEQEVIAKIREGNVTKILLNPTFMDPWHFAIRASKEAWEKFLLPKPPPLYHALFPAMIRQIFHVEGDLELAFAHFWPVTRMIHIMRDIQNR